MEAHRGEPGTLEGLSRFLVQHERCGAGFDVAHPAGLGSGRVSITCRGCGARHEYATATIESEQRRRVDPAKPAQKRRPPAPSRRPPDPPAPRPAPTRPASAGAPKPVRASEAARPQSPAMGTAGPGRAGARGLPGRAPAGRARPRERGPAAIAFRNILRSPRTTLVLLVVAASALGFAVVRVINESGGGERGSTEPVPATPPAAPSPLPEARPGETQPAPPQPPTVTVRTERFTIEVPRGWSERPSAGGLTVEPRGGGRVNVQIYFERSPRLSADRMARQTRQFLVRMVPGARLFPNRVSVAGRPAFELTARGPGETAIAVNVLRGPHRYLIVRRIFAGAKPHVSQAAGRIVRSFEPR